MIHKHAIQRHKSQSFDGALCQQQTVEGITRRRQRIEVVQDVGRMN
jgi:hypothetical protein